MLAFGGHSGKLIGQDWDQKRRHSPRTGGKAKLKKDSWGTQPIQLLWDKKGVIGATAAHLGGERGATRTARR